ncbi:hypothetical protein ACLB2K_050192 [Fragaria x ananassa]
MCISRAQKPTSGQVTPKKTYAEHTLPNVFQNSPLASTALEDRGTLFVHGQNAPRRAPQRPLSSSENILQSRRLRRSRNVSPSAHVRYALKSQKRSPAISPLLLLPPPLPTVVLFHVVEEKTKKERTR